jgi:hypothetical protein
MIGLITSPEDGAIGNGLLIYDFRVLFCGLTFATIQKQLEVRKKKVYYSL